MSKIAGGLVEDTREENDLRMIVVEQIEVAGEVHVGGETVADYTGCDELEPTYECAKVNGWANLEEKSRKERLKLVRKFDPHSYYYSESLLDVIQREPSKAGDGRE